MAEQKLNGPQISAGFEEMYRKCVPKRMRGNGFRETRQTMCFLAGGFDGVLRDRPIVTNAWEEPFFRAKGSPVAAQDLQQLGREHHIPIFTAFAELHADNHPPAVNAGGLQADGFRNAQTCGVAGGQDHAMLGVSHAVKEMHNFFRAQDDG